MHADLLIERAVPDDAAPVAALAGQLLGEIMRTTGVAAFTFDLADTTRRLRDFIAEEKYVVFVARQGSTPPQGFISLCESHALYAEGAFGIIPELYVVPEARTRGLGLKLVNAAREHAARRGWRRLEVTTPPLPDFARTLAFYEREGFAVSGGRKLRALL